MNKKGQTFQLIVKAALAILILAVISYMIYKGSVALGQAQTCAFRGGECRDVCYEGETDIYSPDCFEDEKVCCKKEKKALTKEPEEPKDGTDEGDEEADEEGGETITEEGEEIDEENQLTLPPIEEPEICPNNKKPRISVWYFVLDTEDPSEATLQIGCHDGDDVGMYGDTDICGCERLRYAFTNNNNCDNPISETIETINYANKGAALSTRIPIPRNQDGLPKYTSIYAVVQDKAGELDDECLKIDDTPPNLGFNANKVVGGYEIIATVIDHESETHRKKFYNVSEYDSSKPPELGDFTGNSEFIKYDKIPKNALFQICVEGWNKAGLHDAECTEPLLCLWGQYKNWWQPLGDYKHKCFDCDDRLKCKYFDNNEVGCKGVSRDTADGGCGKTCYWWDENNECNKQPSVCGDGIISYGYENCESDSDCYGDTLTGNCVSCMCESMYP